MRINRGEIYYADLGKKGVGSEQNGVRPVVIIQNNIGNEYSPTVIVAPITSKINTKAKIPTHAFLKGSKIRIPLNSIILLEQITVIDKRRLKDIVGVLDYQETKEMDKAIVVSLGIDIDRIKGKYEETDENIVEIATRKQIAEYAMLARKNLRQCGNLEITDEEFGKYVLELIRLYSPNKIDVAMKSNLSNV